MKSHLSNNVSQVSMAIGTKETVITFSTYLHHVCMEKTLTSILTSWIPKNYQIFYTVLGKEHIVTAFTKDYMPTLQYFKTQNNHNTFKEISAIRALLNGFAETNFGAKIAHKILNIKVYLP